jgi:putative membrane protein
MWNGYGPAAWGLAFMLLSQLALWALIIVVAVYLISRSNGRREPESAERVLAERYARGEIDDEEYRSRLATLRRA